MFCDTILISNQSCCFVSFKKAASARIKEISVAVITGKGASLRKIKRQFKSFAGAVLFAVICGTPQKFSGRSFAAKIAWPLFGSTPLNVLFAFKRNI